jgi:hypothetical protein
MSMYYSMILVPSDPFFHPQPERIVSFFEGIREMGAVGSEPAVRLRTYQRGLVAWVWLHPRTGERMELKAPGITNLDSVKELPTAIRRSRNFDAVIEGAGPARVLPMRNMGGYDNGAWKPLGELISSGICVDEWHLRVECCRRSKLTSTSDLHEETPTARNARPFDHPCELADRAGLYSNPETLELIEVPNAGCSTFWISFTLGKWMFPKLASNKIDFAEPKVMRLAETAFGLPFTEACSWG